MLECRSLIENLEHEVFASFTDTSKLQFLEAFDGVVVRLWIPTIKKKPAHTIPPNCVPVLVATSWVLTLIRVHQDLRFLCSYDPAVTIKRSLNVNYIQKNFVAHQLPVGMSELGDWGFCQLLKSIWKDGADVVFDGEVD